MTRWRKWLARPLGHTGSRIRVEWPAVAISEAAVLPTYIYIEFCPAGPVANPFLFAMHTANRRIREAPADSPAHDAQAFDMPHYIGVYRE